jgi:hypothetical protein
VDTDNRGGNIVATLRDILEIDFGELWSQIETARQKHGISQDDLYFEYRGAKGSASRGAFLNYVRGQRTPRLADAHEYNIAAHVMNRLLVEKGMEPSLPFLTLTAPADGNKLRGRDSNPQPTG